MFDKLLQDFRIITSLLPEGWQQKAYELGATTRTGKVRHPEELLKLILLYQTSGKSYGKTAAMTKVSLGFSITKNAVFQRISKCGAWLSWLCENICRNAGFICEKPGWLSKYNRICLVDTTRVSLEGSDNADYNLHYMLDLFTLDTLEMKLTGSDCGEKLTNFNKLGKNDLMLCDRVYGTLTSINYAISNGSDYCIRLRGNAFNLYDENGNKVDLSELLSDMLEESYISLDLFRNASIGNSDKLEPIRLCIYRKSKEEAKKSVDRIKKSNNNNMGGEVSEIQDFYSNYIVIATSMNDECKRVLELYRMRWQVEILFKRLKSIFDYDDIPTKNESTSRSWLNGKLLLVAICEALVNLGRFSP
jgi:hypothetical protein